MLANRTLSFLPKSSHIGGRCSLSKHLPRGGNHVVGEGRARAKCRRGTKRLGAAKGRRTTEHRRAAEATWGGRDGKWMEGSKKKVQEENLHGESHGPRRRFYTEEKVGRDGSSHRMIRASFQKDISPLSGVRMVRYRGKYLFLLHFTRRHVNLATTATTTKCLVA